MPYIISIFSIIISINLFGYKKLDLTNLSFNSQFEELIIHLEKRKIKFNKKKNKSNKIKKIFFNGKLKTNKFNSKSLKWVVNKSLNGLSISTLNYVLFEKDNNKLIKYLRERKKSFKKYNLTLRNLIQKEIFYYLSYIDRLFIVGFISNNFCHCGINESNIRKFIYNNKIVYLAEKKFTRIENGFKVKHNFKIKISKYGEIVDLNWTQLGERIEKPKMKSKKKKK